MKKLAISFSGGRSSAVMTKLCLEKYSADYKIVITFANTCCEHPATLDFVNACDQNWGFNTVWLEAVINPEHGKGVRHKIVTYETASRRCEPFEAFIKKYGIPNKVTPQCTTKLKELPMESYRRSNGWLTGKRRNYYTAIGIRADEIDRMSSKADDLKLIYPLVEMGIDKAFVNSYMAKTDFDLQLPNDAYGNCLHCFKKSKRKLLTIASQHPEYFDFPKKMEEQYGSLKPGPASAPDGLRYFFRGHESADQIVKEAQEGGFKPYTDKIQLSLLEPELDMGGSCDQGCEVYH